LRSPPAAWVPPPRVRTVHHIGVYPSKRLSSWGWGREGACPLPLSISIDVSDLADCILPHPISGTICIPGTDSLAMKQWRCERCGVDISCPLCQGDGSGPFDIPYSTKSTKCPKCKGTGKKEHTC